MKKLTLAAVSMLTIALAGAAFAGEIYKWTDADGNVHFGDRPTNDQSERLNIQSRPTDPARIQAQTTARAEAKTLAAEEAAAAAAAGPSEEELRTEAEERAQKCTTYKERLQKFVTSRRLYREDEDGERQYLDESETDAARQRAEDRVNQYCNS